MVNNILNMTSRDTDYCLYTGEWLHALDDYCDFNDTVLIVRCTFAPYMLKLTINSNWYIIGGGHNTDFGNNAKKAAIAFFDLCDRERDNQITVNQQLFV